MSDVSGVIAAAREKFSVEAIGEELIVDDDADVHQVAGGCYVAAWVWVENVYVEDRS